MSTWLQGRPQATTASVLLPVPPVTEVSWVTERLCGQFTTGQERLSRNTVLFVVTLLSRKERAPVIHRKSVIVLLVMGNSGWYSSL